MRPKRPTVTSIRRCAAATLASGLLAAAGILSNQAAHSAVFVAPAFGHDIFVLPAQDAITTTQAPNSAVTVTVLRNGLPVGSATGSADSTGAFMVNHPGGVCFTGHTPLLLGGDVVHVETPSGVAEQTVTADITAAPQVNNGGVVEIHGSASSAGGGQLPLDQMDVRIINPARFAINGRRDIRAGGPASPTGTLTYDSPTGHAFTARWSTLSPADVALAMSGSARADWLGANPAAGNEGTVFDIGAIPAPLPECAATAPLANFGVTSATPPAITAASAAADVILAGTATDASSVTANLADPTGKVVSAAATLSAGTGAQTWTATLPAAKVATLADGLLTASGTYNTGAGALTGVTLKISKKVVPPPAPTIAPAGGTFFGPQTLAVTDADATAVLHFTTDGTAPSAASPTATNGGVTLGLGATTLKAVAVDAVGNSSPATVATFDIRPGATLAPAAGAAVGPFSDTATGQRSRPATFQLSNLTTGPVTINEIAIAGTDRTHFAVSSTTCGSPPVQLLAHGQCDIAVVFQPQATGARTARLMVTDSQPDSPLSVALTGTGTAPPAPAAAGPTASSSAAPPAVPAPPATTPTTKAAPKPAPPKPAPKPAAAKPAVAPAGAKATAPASPAPAPAVTAPAVTAPAPTSDTGASTQVALETSAPADTTGRAEAAPPASSNTSHIPIALGGLAVIAAGVFLLVIRRPKANIGRRPAPV